VKSLNGNTCCIAAHQLLQRRALQRKTGVRCETQHRRETILPCNNEKNTVQKGVLKAVMISNSTKFQPAELHLQRSEKFHSLLALKHVCFCFDQGQNTIDMPAQWCRVKRGTPIAECTSVLPTQAGRKMTTRDHKAKCNTATCCIAAHQLLQRRALQRKTGVRSKTQHRRETILPCNNEKTTVQKGVIKAVMISNGMNPQPFELHFHRLWKFHSLCALKHVCFCFDQGQNTIDMPAQWCRVKRGTPIAECTSVLPTQAGRKMTTRDHKAKCNS
jgi:hypothetical protein